jgi:hypothetical protein
MTTKILHTFKIELKLTTLVVEDNYIYPTPNRWDWDTLLDLSDDEEVEIISCVDMDAENE